jgi:hypothetical protein
VLSAGNDGGNNSLAGERTLEIFGVGGNFLGIFDQADIGTFSVSSLVSNTPIESFSLTSPGFDSFTVSDIQFNQAVAVPFEFDPAGGLLILGGFWLGRKQLKKYFQKKSK